VTGDPFRQVLAIAVLAGAAMVCLIGSTHLSHADSIRDQGLQMSHEDPAAAAGDRDAVALLQLFGDALAYERAGQYANARSLLLLLSQASFSGEVRLLVDRQRDFVAGLADGREGVDGALNRAVALLRANGKADVAVLLKQARQHLKRNRFFLESSRSGFQVLAGRLGIPGLPATAPARQRLARVAQIHDEIADYERLQVQRVERLEKRQLWDPGELGLLGTSLQWVIPERVSPGLPFTIWGVVVTESAPAAALRQLILSLDNRMLGEFSVRGRFQVPLMAPGDLPTGWHRLTAVIRAQGRYAETSATRSLQIVKTPVIVKIRVGRVAWLPGAVAVSGEIRSALALSEAARVEVRLGPSSGVTSSGPGGAFRVVVRPPLMLGFAGYQRLQVRVSPVEPWQAPGEAEARLYVVNLLNFGLASFAFAPLVSAVYGGVKRQRRRRADAAVPALEATLEAGAVHDGLVHPDEEPLSMREHLLELYDNTVRQIEERTGTRLQPHQTFKEFQRTTSSAPGRQAFARMTALAEVALYSSHPVTRGMLVGMQQLRGELTKELGHEH
jgi:hypothetical protein